MSRHGATSPTFPLLGAIGRMKNPVSSRTLLVYSLRPISDDPAAAVALAREAVRSHRDPDEESAPFLSSVEGDIASGAARGVLRMHDGRAVGIALWSPPNPPGLRVEILHLEDGRGSESAYREFFREVEATAGPVAFAPGRLAGLTASDERHLMESLGFAMFARSEMRFPPEAETPGARAVDGLAPFAPEDEPGLRRVYREAYGERLDRYLFLLDPDPEKEALAAMREILDGRWGEFLPWASFVVRDGGRVVAATLVTRASYGPLIAHVMVDPERQGRGLGRAVLIATVRALRSHGESVIVLNVTEGNTRAIGLYERVGFVRTLGPFHGWYSTARVPVRPAGD